MPVSKGIMELIGDGKVKQQKGEEHFMTTPVYFA